MFCPMCGHEYYEGFVECEGCGVPLVEDPPSPESLQDVRFVSVFKTGDPALLAVAKSLLEMASIPYFAKGEGVQDLFGLGRLGTGFNPLTGPADLQVDQRFRAEASRVLKELIEDAHSSRDD